MCGLMLHERSAVVVADTSSLVDYLNTQCLPEVLDTGITVRGTGLDAGIRTETMAQVVG